MQLLAEGRVEKMLTTLGEQVGYQLPLSEQRVDMNALLGQTVKMQYEGMITCLYCDRKSKKSFSQGFCYPCFKRLARCDNCIVSPEKCHFHEGTCREPEWAEQFCMTDHYVYLANSSGLKVGITRGNQIPTRWMDQGATQALPILRVSTRQQSGLVETALKAHVNDKTNWRAMLKGNAEPLDMVAERDRLLAEVADDIAALQQQFGLQAIEILDTNDVTTIDYPVLEFPTKVTSFNFDKHPEVSGRLMGIKGQYLILDTGVINMRKFGAYHIQLSADV